MRSIRGAGTGPFRERLHYELHEIDEICIQALKGVGCLPQQPEPVRIDRFIEKHFRCPIDYDDLGDGVLGCTVFRKDGSVERVVISSDLDDGEQVSERRLRSTLAHEAGHGLLHAQLFMEGSSAQLALDSGLSLVRHDRILCRGGEIGTGSGRRLYDGKWWEFQANRAIGGLLLPQRLVAQVVEIEVRGEANGLPLSLATGEREKLAKLIAQTFDVNPVVARIRLSEMWSESAGPTLF